MTIRDSTIDESGREPSTGGGSGVDVVQSLADPRADEVLSTQGLADELVDRPTTNETLALISDALAPYNRLPIVQEALRTIADTTLTATGNLMDNVTDPDDDDVTFVGISYNDVARTNGVPFATTYGTMVVTSEGVYTFTLGSAAHALNAGQSATEQFSYSVMDTSGGRRTGNFQITITGTNQTPVARPDTQSVGAGETATGNVLNNDTDLEGQTLTVVSFVVAGSATVHLAGAVATIPDVGTVTIASNGAYSFVPLNSDVTGVVPLVTYKITDGTNEGTGTLRISIAPPPPTASEMEAFFAVYREQPDIERSAPNPLPSRPLPDRSFVQDVAGYTPWDYTLSLPNQSGRPTNAYDFEVGPGKPYTELTQVPWEYLLPGDRVFVYQRAEPYKNTIVLSASGTEDAWIELIGVRNEYTGAMPILDGDGAVCAAGRHYQLFGDNALVGIGPFTAGQDGTAYGTKVRFIHVTGFEMRNAHLSKQRYVRGSSSLSNWQEFAQGVYVLGGHNICIQGNKIHNCGQGVFVNSTNHDRFQSHRIHICNNHIYDCSSSGSYSTHGMYLESIAGIVEYNWLGNVIDGSNGDTVKDRTCGVVYRYNYIESSANCVAFRDPSNEDDAQNGVLEATALDAWGELMVKSIYVYGNTFVVRRSTPQAVLGIGDGGNGELREGTLYFYSNVVATIMDGQSGYTGVYYDPYRVALFSMWNVRSPIKAVARNNLLYTTVATGGSKQAPFGLFSWQGLAEFTENWVNDFTLTSFDTNYAANLAKGVQFTGTGLGGLSESSGSPGFVNVSSFDLELLETSPFFDLGASVHADAVDRNLIPTRRSVLYPFDLVPIPSVISNPVVTGNHIEGSTVTASGYSFSPLAESYLFQWYFGSGSEIEGATSSTFDTTGLAGEFIRVGVRGVNRGGAQVSAEAMSANFQVVSASTPANTVLPQITGSRQPGYELEVSNGEWTNSPTGFTYQWFKVVGLTRAPISGATTNKVTPQLGDEGSIYECDVGAIKGSETGYATANGVMIVPAQYDPDGYNVWNFAAAVNTPIKDLDSKWLGQVTLGYYPANEYYFCDGNGKLVGTYIAKNNSGLVWYANGQGDVQQATVTFTIPDPAVISGWEGGPSVNCGGPDLGSPNNYSVQMNPTAIKLMRNGSQLATTAHTKVKDDAITLKLMRKSGGVLEVYLNGTMVINQTDGSPLTGGYPGLNLNPGSTETFGFDTWHENP